MTIDLHNRWIFISFTYLFSGKALLKWVMQNTGRLKIPTLKWAMHITGKLINLVLKCVISTALKCPYVLLNLALKCPAPVTHILMSLTQLGRTDWGTKYERMTLLFSYIWGGYKFLKRWRPTSLWHTCVSCFNHWSAEWCYVVLFYSHETMLKSFFNLQIWTERPPPPC